MFELAAAGSGPSHIEGRRMQQPQRPLEDLIPPQFAGQRDPANQHISDKKQPQSQLYAVEADHLLAPNSEANRNRTVHVENSGQRSTIPPDKRAKSRAETENYAGLERREKAAALLKLHEKSSAETSGLGDSLTLLQRIHALSSTETSGFGEPSPAISPALDTTADSRRYHDVTTRREPPPKQHHQRHLRPTDDHRYRRRIERRQMSLEEEDWQHGGGYQSPRDHVERNDWRRGHAMGRSHPDLRGRRHGGNQPEFYTPPPTIQPNSHRHNPHPPHHGQHYDATASYSSSGEPRVLRSVRSEERDYDWPQRAPNHAASRHLSADSMLEITNKEPESRPRNTQNVYSPQRMEFAQHSGPTCFVPEKPSSANENQVPVKVVRKAPILKNKGQNGSVANLPAVPMSEKTEDSGNQPAPSSVVTSKSKSEKFQTLFSQVDQFGSGPTATDAADKEVTELTAEERKRNPAADLLKSDWLKWSHERKRSYDDKIDSINKRAENIAQFRVSTPIKKAREECQTFLAPKVEKEAPADETAENLKRIQSIIPNRRKIRMEIERQRSDGKLTGSQWNILTEYWEHSTLMRLRYVALLLGIVATALLVVSVLGNDWFRKNDVEFGQVNSGLYGQCADIPNSPERNCTITLPDTKWQIGAVGLLVFTCAFGLLGSFLSISGLCASTLPTRIYYYHSAAEVYFICALCMLTSLIIYPAAVQKEYDVTPLQYGVGYGLGWGASFFFFTSAICMTIDDLIRATTKGRFCGKTENV